MTDFNHIFGQAAADVQIFRANSTSASTAWTSWRKRMGTSMVYIIVIGGGGGGGSGTTGAASTAAGGGGGSSAGATIISIPSILMPDTLYMSVGYGGAPSSVGTPSYVAAQPITTANFVYALANGGNPGGNANAATPGTGATAPGAATLISMPLGTTFGTGLINGQAGTAGGSTANGTNLNLSTSGVFLTGGTGGAGLGAVNTPGSTGGSYTVPANQGFFPPNAGGTGGTATNAPGNQGSNGLSFVSKALYCYGGTGGGSGGLAAAGAATASGGIGGNGGTGCGGGGGGGGFTGATNASGGNGGDGMIIVVSW